MNQSNYEFISFSLSLPALKLIYELTVGRSKKCKAQKSFKMFFSFLKVKSKLFRNISFQKYVWELKLFFSRFYPENASDPEE